MSDIYDAMQDCINVLGDHLAQSQGGDVDMVLVCFSGKPKKMNILGSFEEGQEIFAALMSACKAVAENEEQDFPALLRGIAEAHEKKLEEVVEH